jgi:hypothetical protein
VIIRDFGFKRIAIFKPEAQSPLLIDPYTPAALTITCKLFQSIARRRLQEFDRASAMQKYQFSFGLRAQGQKSPGTPALKQLLRIFASKGLDHRKSSILRVT